VLAIGSLKIPALCDLEFCVIFGATKTNEASPSPNGTKQSSDDLWFQFGCRTTSEESRVTNHGF
jgi:hypothetical protein